ncbi:MAG: DUF4351 domain-containing protein [Microcystaceae cyanobacterium]
MKESVIYQDIFQKGTQQEAFQFLFRLLNKRFGTVDSSISARLRTLSQEQLESLGEALFDFTDQTDVETWLNQL